MGNNLSSTVKNHRGSCKLRDSCKLSQKDVEMFDEFNKLSDIQIEQMYKKFKGATDGEKNMNRRKFSDIMHQCFPRTHKTDLEEFVFKLYDVNDDGKISFEEFLVMMSIMNNGTASQKIEQIFRVFDANKNGFITKDELFKLVDTLYHLIPAAEVAALTSPEKVVDEIINEIDDDQDGIITKEELAKAVQRSEHLTTLVIDKILLRFACACYQIMQKSRD